MAAGASTRLGRPKQLLQWEGSPLIFHLTLQAILSAASRTLVVVGCQAARVANVLIGLDAHLVENSDWKAGVSSSIHRAVEAALEDPPLDGLLILTCDQPHVTAETVNRLLKAQSESGRTIVASEYGGTWGVPALFMRSHFPELLQLQGDRGAKEIISRHRASVETVPFPKGAVDLDTEEDLKNLGGPAT